MATRDFRAQKYLLSMDERVRSWQLRGFCPTFVHGHLDKSRRRKPYSSKNVTNTHIPFVLLSTYPRTHHFSHACAQTPLDKRTKVPLLVFLTLNFQGRNRNESQLFVLLILLAHVESTSSQPMPTPRTGAAVDLRRAT